MTRKMWTKWFVGMAAWLLLAVSGRADVTVKDVSVKPRWPWNGLVDVTYTVICDEKDEENNKPKEIYVDFTAIDGDRNQTIPMKTLTGDGAKDPVTGDGGGKTYTVTWDMAKDAPALNSSELKVQIHAIAGDAPYLVIDLLTWKKHYTSQPPDLNDDTCRTTELWLRQVKPGTFKMGDANGSDAKPVHDVTITKMFYIGVFECTQAQWNYVMGNSGGNRYPVNNVSYNWIRGLSHLWPGDAYNVDGSSFMGRLRTKLDNKLVFDLPTEAQWEFAARGGNESKGYTYSGSNNIDAVAWYWYPYNYVRQTHAVGTKEPNELGLYDMSGNVLEWCLDWYKNTYYSESPKNDPSGASSGSLRVLRGGSWDFIAERCRSAYRFNNDPSNWYSYPSSGYGSNTGFRVVCLPLVR